MASKENPNAAAFPPITPPIWRKVTGVGPVPGAKATPRKAVFAAAVASSVGVPENVPL